MEFSQILNKTEFSKADLVQLLAAEGDDLKLLYEKATEVKLAAPKVTRWLAFRSIVPMGAFNTPFCTISAALLERASSDELQCMHRALCENERVVAEILWHRMGLRQSFGVRYPHGRDESPSGAAASEGGRGQEAESGVGEAHEARRGRTTPPDTA